MVFKLYVKHYTVKFISHPKYLATCPVGRKDGDLWRDSILTPLPPSHLEAAWGCGKSAHV